MSSSLTMHPPLSVPLNLIKFFMLDPSESDLLKHFDMTSDHYPFDMKEQVSNEFAFNDVFDNVFNL